MSLPEVVNATLQMGNPANKEILREAGLLTADVADAGPTGIIALVQARSICQGQPNLPHPGGADDFLDYFKGSFMYSYEDRLRAVQLYIKLGKRAGLTIRQLGYLKLPRFRGHFSSQRQGVRNACIQAAVCGGVS
ncbi:MAG: hypothetical protein ABIX46_09890 [Burkholderiaceae bacterium]